jgi:hypothetical protein
MAWNHRYAVTVLCMGYFTACFIFWRQTLGNIRQSKDLLSCWNQNGKLYLLSYNINQFLYPYLGVPVIFMSISKYAPFTNTKNCKTVAHQLPYLVYTRCKTYSKWTILIISRSTRVDSTFPHSISRWRYFQCLKCLPLSESLKV